MKILRPVCPGVAGIFFPIGRPEIGGTCEYASELCLKKCYALKKDYDEQVNIPEEDKREIHRFFTEQPAVSVCNEVIKEMGELQAKILSWFTSGDCLDKDIGRICQLMQLLNEEGIIQNGFTRSERLYNKAIDVMKHLVLTVESKEAKDAPYKGRSYPKGIWAMPNYENGIVKLYYGEWGSKTVRAGCGFSEVTANFEGKKIAIASNCLGCYNKKIGCFIDLTKEKMVK